MGISVESTVWLFFSTVSISTWNLEMLVFVQGGKREYPEKNQWSRDENHQQTQPTHDAETRNRNRATLVGSGCSHHCAIPAPSQLFLLEESSLSMNLNCSIALLQEHKE